MELRLTLVADDASTADVLVRAADGDTVGDLLSVLAGDGRVRIGSVLVVGEQPLFATDLVGLPPLLDGAVLRVTSARSGGGRRAGRPVATSPIRLDVVGGPDAGGSLALRPGRHRIGRGADLELTVADPHLSRVHAEVEVTASGITVRDVSSTNGLARVGTEGGVTAFGEGLVSVGDHLRIGQTTLAVRAGLARPLVGRPVGDGTVAMTRTSGTTSRWAPVTLTAPVPPGPTSAARFPWVQVLLPLPVCAVLAWLWGPQMLVFVLLGPLLAGGTAIGDRVGSRRGARAEQARHASALAAHEAARRDATAAERAHLAAIHPDPCAVLGAARTPTGRLWERSADAADGLVVRLGSATVAGATHEASASGAREAERLSLPEAPVTVDLSAVGSLGIRGAEELGVRTSTSLLLQLATLVTPDSLSIDALGDGPAWRWVGLLPHGHPDGVDVVATLHSRLERAPGDARAAVLLVPHSGLVATTPGLDDLVRRGPAHGVHVIVLDTDGHGLPADLGATLDVHPDPALVALSTSAALDGAPLLLDGVAPRRGESVARSLAPLRVAGSAVGSALPDRLALADLHGAPTAESVLAHWALRAGPVAVVGADASGAMALDLRRDGPHALVGGTTGAGKSELLRTLVAGLALGSAPEDLAFVLVDYKGGAAFGDLAGLPHVAALVTDLDSDLVERALVSLTAELRRRERILATTGAPDLDEHLRRGGEGLPRLVIVVDELRALVDELPAFVQGLVRIASLGRSLGVHLVLATQRPAGVVSADIAANVNLRIALRVRDRVDSEAIVGTPHAAVLPAGSPGRAIAAVAGGETTFQSALVTPDECPEPPLTVVGDGWEASGPARPLPPPKQVGVAETVRAAARLGGHAAAVAPWRPPLPEQLAWVEERSSTSALGLGLVDRPDEQRTDVLRWSPADDGHLAVVGGARSGRTTTLATVVGAVLADDASWQVHVLQATNALSGLSAARRVGSVVPLHDRELVGRFVDRLDAEVARRRGAGTDGPPRPSILVAIDGWDVLAGAVTDLSGHELLERLLGVLRDGPAVGVHAVATGGRALVQGRTGERFARRLALGSLDPTEALHLGLVASRSTTPRPPGRGIDVGTGHACHVARHGSGPEAGDDVCAVLALDRRRARIDAGPRPFRIEPLPTVVSADGILGQPGAIGVDADGGPVGFGAEDLHVLVAGPRRSGRSTALRALARAWAADGRTALLVATTPTDGVAHLSPDRVEEVAAHLRSHPATALLVDDVDHFGDGPLEALVLEAVATAARRGAPVAVSAESGALVTAFRGVAIQVAGRRTGLLLSPRGAADGDVLGVRVRGPREVVPGRGLLVRAGAAAVVQVVTDEQVLMSASTGEVCADPIVPAVQGAT